MLQYALNIQTNCKLYSMKMALASGIFCVFISISPLSRLPGVQEDSQFRSCVWFRKGTSSLSLRVRGGGVTELTKGAIHLKVGIKPHQVEKMQ